MCDTGDTVAMCDTAMCDTGEQLQCVIQGTQQCDTMCDTGHNV